MSVTFTKLFSSITESTIWVEPHYIRIVWITMLAMADRKGRVWASIPGLANRARVSVDEAEESIKRFLSPDKYSRTPDHDGKRIEPIDGGWRLLNYEKYRGVMDEEARREYKRDWDRTHRQNPTNLSESDNDRHQTTQAEAEAEAEAEADKIKRVGRARKTRTPRLTDEEFLQNLKTLPAYKHIDLEAELSRMDAWLLAHPGRQKTKRFIVNWLNRIDKPLERGGVDPILVDPT